MQSLTLGLLMHISLKLPARSCGGQFGQAAGRRAGNGAWQSMSTGRGEACATEGNRERSCSLRFA